MPYSSPLSDARLVGGENASFAHARGHILLEHAQTLNARQWAAATSSLLLAWWMSRIIYNLYFHPLAHFPGPLLARASLFWRFWHTMRGRSHRVIEQQHRKYGPVFRVSPNELSFASVQSWKDIYGFPPPGQAHLVKGEFYDVYGSGYKTGCVGSERNPKLHAQKKKNLTAAFSTKALASQEAIVQRCWDQFVDKIGPLSRQSDGGINIVKWLEMVTFDILGEMAFGEGFECIESEKYHFWIDLIMNHMLEVTLVDNLRRIKFVATLGRLILPSLTVKMREKHSGYSRAKVQKRLDAANTRQDFLTNIVGKVKSGEVEQEELTAHASTLIIAGGETTATCLAAAFYYLLKTPETLKKLQEEIRTRYPKYEDIDAASAQKLPYLMAVIQEALRIHPPGSQGFPRVSPGVMIDGHYVPAGTEVYTSAWTVTHDPKYFHEPMRFKPERWIDPDCTDIKEASQPFSLGYRACIGRNFAFVELTLCLSKMVHRYDWELVNKDMDWEGRSHSHVMWWKAPVYVRFTERKA